jgi:hypothetical protein
MIRVLVANRDKSEGKSWNSKLTENGLTIVAECSNLSDMVHLLMQERIDIILCSENLIDENAFLILKASAKYFPETKIITIGILKNQKSAEIFEFSNVVNVKNFNTALENYCKINPALTKKEIISQKSNEQNARILIDDHYLSQEDVTMLLEQTFKWVAGYTIIGVLVDSSCDDVLLALKNKAIEQDYAYVLQFKMNEFYVILDKSPTVERSMQLANDIRNRLFKETGAKFSIGVSRMRNKASELYACRKEAARACRATRTFGYNNVIHIDYVDSNDIEYLYPKHKEEKLIEATMDGDIDTAFKMLDDIFDIFRYSKNLKQGLVNKIILGIIVNLNIEATARVFVFEKINLDSLSLSKLLTSKSIDEAYSFLKRGIEDFAKEMDAFTDVSRDALFFKLTELRKSDYPISISDLTRELGTTVGFINTAINRNCNGDIFSFFDNGCTM